MAFTHGMQLTPGSVRLFLTWLWIGSDRNGTDRIGAQTMRRRLCLSLSDTANGNVGMRVSCMLPPTSEYLTQNVNKNHLDKKKKK